MASPIAVSPPPNLVALELRQFTDVDKAIGAARRFAHSGGFSAVECERLALVAAELASNLVRQSWLSDGLESRWDWKDFEAMAQEAPALIARRLLKQLGTLEDDATVLVARNAKSC